MKTIVLVALLASSLAPLTACSKKAGSDCDAPINKGMDNFTSMLKSKGSNMPSVPMQAQIFERARTTFIGRCHEDKWAPEVAECFATVQNQRDVVKCESKLTEEQRTNLHVALRESRQGMMQKMPNIPGHPQYLQGTSPMSVGGTPATGSAAPAAGSAAAGSAAPAPAAPAPAAGSAGSAAGSGSAAPAGGW